jgi:hypothetical protein
MVVVEINGKQIYMDGYLKQNLDLAKHTIKKDWDFIFAVDGNEGAGKSLLTQQAAGYCDPTLCIERICFTPEEFKVQVLTAKQYQSIIFDEAYGGLSSRAAMSSVNKILVDMLTQIRQKNLFIFIVLPCFFDLDKYVSLWRSRALIHIYTGDNMERGYFSFYNSERKKDLYVYGKKFYSYKMPGPNFRGRFANQYVVDKDKYKQKKLDSLTNIDQQKTSPDHDDEIRRAVQVEFYERIAQLPLKSNIKMIIMGMSSGGYSNFTTRYKEAVRIKIAKE